MADLKGFKNERSRVSVQHFKTFATVEKLLGVRQAHAHSSDAERY